MLGAQLGVQFVYSVRPWDADIRDGTVWLDSIDSKITRMGPSSSLHEVLEGGVEVWLTFIFCSHDPGEVMLCVADADTS